MITPVPSRVSRPCLGHGPQQSLRRCWEPRRVPNLRFSMPPPGLYQAGGQTPEQTIVKPLKVPQIGTSATFP
jgi:hypothetical protein